MDSLSYYSNTLSPITYSIIGEKKLVERSEIIRDNTTTISTIETAEIECPHCRERFEGVINTYADKAVITIPLKEDHINKCYRSKIRDMFLEEADYKILEPRDNCLDCKFSRTDCDNETFCERIVIHEGIEYKLGTMMDEDNICKYYESRY